MAKVLPDRKKYAYLDRTKGDAGNQIIVMSATGQILQTIPTQKSWWNLLRWQTNDSLLIQTTELLSSSGATPPPVLAVLNIITRKIQKLEPNFPGIEDNNIRHGSN